MSVCPNCGAVSNGGKFCENCGGALPVEQPVQQVQQPAQPIQSYPVEPVQSQPVQPAQPIQSYPVEPVQPQPVQQPQPVPVQPVVYPQAVPPVYQSVQPVYQPPVYSQPVPGYTAQPAVEPEKKKGTNGACIAGFILGLVGIFTFGIPSLIGFIVSTIGLIVACVKKQKGKVLGTIGIILSLLMIVGWVLFIANADKIAEALDANGEGQSFEEWLFDDSYDGKIEIISETEWVEKTSGSRLIFGADNKFNYYNDYYDLNNNYYSGTYEIYFGYEGINLIEEKYSQYGYTSDDICDMIETERGVSGVKDFVVLIFHNDGCWIDGVNTIDLKWDTVYMGYYDNNRLVMDLTYLEDGSKRTFVAFNDFDASGIVPTAATVLDEALWGNETVGYVELSQGEWTDCDESDLLAYSYLDKIQKYNAETETVIQLSVISGQYNPSYAKEIAEEFKSVMEENDYAVSEVEETTFGGYTAYVVSTQFDDGEYLTAWYFVDDDLRLHYVTVEYYDSDIASYEMVRDTYTYTKD